MLKWALGDPFRIGRFSFRCSCIGDAVPARFGVNGVDMR
jgi:hypothetical protein